MYTRCPHCETVFRVTPQQLQASSGQVRCGRCQQVFDAFSTLSAQLPAGTPGHAEEIEDERQSIQPAAADDVAEREKPPPRANASPAPDAASHLRTATEPELTLPAGVLSDEPPVRRPHPALTAGVLALVALAAAQATWLFATPLALWVPAARPMLERVCERLACVVSLPRLPDQLFIETSELQLLDAAHPNYVMLSATVRNRAGLSQAFPLLELTLTSASNQTVARRVFSPEEYLEHGLDRTHGLGANQEISIRLYLNTGEVRAAGYRLYLFFA
jgi:predicted Zn finger-like uncharacterized protein